MSTDFILVDKVTKIAFDSNYIFFIVSSIFNHLQITFTVKSTKMEPVVYQTRHLANAIVLRATMETDAVSVVV